MLAEDFCYLRFFLVCFCFCFALFFCGEGGGAYHPNFTLSSAKFTFSQGSVVKKPRVLTSLSLFTIAPRGKRAGNFSCG